MAADVTIYAALIAGLVSFLSPCVLPLVPPYLVYLAGTSLERLAEAAPPPRVRRDAVASIQGEPQSRTAGMTSSSQFSPGRLWHVASSPTAGVTGRFGPRSERQPWSSPSESTVPSTA